MDLKRWDIINHLIKKNGYTSYLEIGYYKGWSFDRVECNHKTAVDPNPCKTPDQEKWTNESLHFLKLGEQMKESIARPVKEAIYKMTSDKYFGEYIVDASGKSMFSFDIIFIDGLHESTQVDRDIQNALKHLNPGGTIVMHDCNPSTEEMTLGGTASGEWTGDVYKSFIDFCYSAKNENEFRQRIYDAYVVDTDYGVGIIRKSDLKWSLSRMSPLPDYITNKEYYSFPVFAQHKEQLLNLRSVKDFLFIEKYENQIENAI